MIYERAGDDFRFTWPESQVRLIVRNIDRRSGRFYGEVWAESADPRLTGPMYWGHLPLDSSRERNGFALALADRTKLAFPDVKIDVWKELVLVACMRAASEFRGAVAGQILADVPVDRGEEYLFPGFLPLGETSSIFADGGAGKSLLALLLAICVATGRPLAGFQPTAQGPVMVCDWETTAEEQAKRARAICHGSDIELPRSLHYYGLDRPLVDLAPQLRAEADQLGAVFIVFDSAVAALDGPAKDDEVARRYMNALRTFRPLTRLFLTHVTKADARDESGKPSSFGSIFFKNYSRRQWTLEKEGEYENTTDLTLVLAKKNWGRQPLPVSLRLTAEEHEQRVSFTRYQSEEAQMRYASNPEKVRLALKGAHGMLDTGALIERTKIKRDVLLATLSRMGDVKNFGTEAGGRGKEARWGLLAHGERNPNALGFSQNGVRDYAQAEFVPVAVGAVPNGEEAFIDHGEPF